MKILNVNITLDPVRGGGTAERTFQMSRSLAARGAACRVLTLDVGLTPERREALEALGLTALPCFNGRYNLPAGGRRLVDELVADADIVHLMGHWNLLNVWAYRSLRRLRKPYVVCPAGELPVFGRSRRLKLAFNTLVGRRIVREAALHVAITSREAEQFAAYAVDPAQVVVLPNGVAESEFTDADGAAFRSKFGLGNRAFVLFVGRLNPIKGPDLLLKAFERIAVRLPDLDLVFAGPDGGSLAELRRRASAAGLETRVKFVGYLGGREKSQAYHAASLLAIPSRSEAMSIVVLESGICGTPVLITDQCGFDDVERVGGGRVVAATSEALAEGLMELFSRARHLPELGARLRHYVRADFTWTNLADRYLNHYDRLVAKSAASAQHPRRACA